MRQVGRYNVDDPSKIQGRDEVEATDRSVAAIRLNHCLKALENVTGRVLLLGCGAGRYVRAFYRSRPDLEIAGADLSILALREARGIDPGGTYIALDASELPFNDESFNAVVFFDLLEHVPDYKRMLLEIARVLRPEGILHFYAPLENQPWTIYRALKDSRWIPFLRWKRDHVGHINFFSAEEVLADTWEASLEVVDARYGFHPFGQIHDLIDYWQRERQSGGHGYLPLRGVRLVSRIAFLFTWRLSYAEDRLYEGRLLGSGLHLTAIKR
jgi:SAM-dependent methyltransferase